MSSLVSGDPSEQYSKIRSDVGAMLIERDSVSVVGPEAGSYLQGQLSQNVEAIAVGSSAWSFLLQPHGKVDAFVRVTHTDDGSFLIDTDPGFGSLVKERLERFKLRTKAEIALSDLRVLALRGPRSHAAAETFDAVRADAGWPGLDGVDLFAKDFDVPSEIPMCDGDIYEALRIETGMPRMGQELDERTIPAEAGVNARAIDFKKGCYTGQELVARIDARGNNVPRRLRGLVISGDYVPPLGSKILTGVNGGKAIGALSSAAFSWHFDSPVGLAMIRRDVAPGTTALIDDGGLVECTIRELPLIS